MPKIAQIFWIVHARRSIPLASPPPRHSTPFCALLVIHLEASFNKVCFCLSDVFCELDSGVWTGIKAHQVHANVAQGVRTEGDQGPKGELSNGGREGGREVYKKGLDVDFELQIEQGVSALWRGGREGGREIAIHDYTGLSPILRIEGIEFPTGKKEREGGREGGRETGNEKGRLEMENAMNITIIFILLTT